MRFAQPSPTHVITRSEKEAKLKSFVVEGLAAQAGDAAELTVVARGFDSPIVAAVEGALANVTGGVAVRVIVMDSTGDGAAALDAAGAEFRILKDSRFGAAHEQVVASAGHVWIGDCMRRDPSKRDAFEMLHTGAAAETCHAARSFEHLWMTAEPLKIVAKVAPELLVAGAEPAAETFGQGR